MPEPVVQQHSKPGKVGVLLIHGTADQVVAYSGKPTGYLSAEDTYSYWLKRNGIGSAGASHRVIGFRMVQEVIQQRRRERAVVVEDFCPILECAVRRDDGGAVFIATADS